jgi:hypothetical protein
MPCIPDTLCRCLRTVEISRVFENSKNEAEYSLKYTNREDFIAQLRVNVLALLA